MEKLLFAAGTSFLRAFGIAFLGFSIGILGATNLSAAVALSIAALSASIAAGLRTLVFFVPQLSFEQFLPQPYAAWVDSFVRAFFANAIPAVAGWLAAPNWSVWHAALLGILTGAATAALRALQGLVTPSESPNKGSGIGPTSEPAPA